MNSWLVAARWLGIFQLRIQPAGYRDKPGAFAINAIARNHEARLDADPPLVSVMIATRDRAPELRATLELLRHQTYEAIEIVVIDDGSKEPVEAVVRAFYPDARVIRHEESRGQCERRNEGFAAARGEFILHLDDDCCFTKPNDLAEGVHSLIARPTAGAVVFDLYNGPTLPEELDPSRANAGCVRSFVGAAVLFRTEAIRQTAGYRTFYQAQGEEDELALQLLSKGWCIFYCPWILAHHRLSSLNRNSLATWGRGVGNEIWSRILHLPVRRLPAEIGWKVAVAFGDAIRLLRYRAFFQAIWRCVLGLKRVWRLREPLSPLALRRYDALRLRSVLTEAEFADPPTVSAADCLGFWRRWRNRARDSSFWEGGPSGRGESNIARYAHGFQKPVARPAREKD